MLLARVIAPRERLKWRHTTDAYGEFYTHDCVGMGRIAGISGGVRALWAVNGPCGAVFAWPAGHGPPSRFALFEALQST